MTVIKKEELKKYETIASKLKNLQLTGDNKKKLTSDKDGIFRLSKDDPNYKRWIDK